MQSINIYGASCNVHSFRTELHASATITPGAPLPVRTAAHVICKPDEQIATAAAGMTIAVLFHIANVDPIGLGQHRSSRTDRGSSGILRFDEAGQAPASLRSRPGRSRPPRACPRRSAASADRRPRPGCEPVPQPSPRPNDAACRRSGPGSRPPRPLGSVKGNRVSWPAPPLVARMRSQMRIYQSLPDGQAQAGPRPRACRRHPRRTCVTGAAAVRRNASTLARDRDREGNAIAFRVDSDGEPTRESLGTRWRRGCSGSGRCSLLVGMTRGRSAGRATWRLCRAPPLSRVSSYLVHLVGRPPPPVGARPIACPGRCAPHPAGR